MTKMHEFGLKEKIRLDLLMQEIRVAIGKNFSSPDKDGYLITRGAQKKRLFVYSNEIILKPDLVLIQTVIDNHVYTKPDPQAPIATLKKQYALANNINEKIDLLAKKVGLK